MDYKIDPKQVRDLNKNLEKMKVLADIREVDPETLEIDNHKLKVIASSTGGVTKSYVDSGDKNNKDYIDSKINTLSTVAKTGNYNELNNKPDLKPVATSGSYSDLENKPALKPVATSGSYNDLTGKPNLHTVATSGSYNDLKDKPNISDSIIYKKIYSYTVDDFDTEQEVVKEVPLDFNKYWKIIVDAHYESGEGTSQRWDYVQAIVNNPPMTFANCLQVGAQHNATNREPIVRTLDQVVAVWTVAHFASSYHIEIMTNNELKNFPMYRAESFGGTTGNLFTQEISGRIIAHPRNITALKIMLNRPEKGGKIVVYGVEK
uniref:Uncharacterized protein n=1 Tax=Podoviridae sp. ctefc32 TaxID=2827742 RepID=A0A8S5T220_9CAUD|nr:MAG TPA: hypothetical protein [Podoviridae sp. ctefc32]